jgi:hypothetical protein
VRGRKWLWLPTILLLVLISCQNSEKPNTTIAETPVQQSEDQNKAQLELGQLRKEKTSLEIRVKELEVAESISREALRQTLNLSFKIFNAMTENDLAYLESVSAPGVSINQSSNSIHFDSNGTPSETKFISSINLKNMEYRGYNIIGDDMELFFAKYLNDGHVSIYMRYVKQGDQWLFNGFYTN